MISQQHYVHLRLISQAFPKFFSDFPWNIKYFGQLKSMECNICSIPTIQAATANVMAQMHLSHQNRNSCTTCQFGAIWSTLDGCQFHKTAREPYGKLLPIWSWAGKLGELQILWKQ